MADLPNITRDEKGTLTYFLLLAHIVLLVLTTPIDRVLLSLILLPLPVEGGFDFCADILDSAIVPFDLNGMVLVSLPNFRRNLSELRLRQRS